MFSNICKSSSEFISIDYILLPTPALKALAPIVVRILLAPRKVCNDCYFKSANIFLENPNLLADLLWLAKPLLSFDAESFLRLATGTGSSLDEDEEGG